MAEEQTGDDPTTPPPDAVDSPTDNGRQGLEPAARSERSPVADDLPFASLVAPEPLPATPPTAARWLGFGSIVVGGILGAMIGWGTGDVLGGSEIWAAVGALAGAVFCAVGVGVVASLTLRAMNEWNAVQHPEADSG